MGSAYGPCNQPPRHAWCRYFSFPVDFFLCQEWNILPLTCTLLSYPNWHLKKKWLIQRWSFVNLHNPSYDIRQKLLPPLLYYFNTRQGYPLSYQMISLLCTPHICKLNIKKRRAKWGGGAGENRKRWKKT